MPKFENWNYIMFSSLLNEEIKVFLPQCLTKLSSFYKWIQLTDMREFMEGSSELLKGDNIIRFDKGRGKSYYHAAKEFCDFFWEVISEYSLLPELFYNGSNPAI